MKYNLTGNLNQLRLEICAQQTSYKTMMHCVRDVKEIADDPRVVGIETGILMTTAIVMCFILGHWSKKTPTD